MYRSRTEARRPSASAMVLTSSTAPKAWVDPALRQRLRTTTAHRLARVVVVVVRVVRVVVFVVAPTAAAAAGPVGIVSSRIVPVVSPVGARRERRRRPVRLILPGGIFFGFRGWRRAGRVWRGDDASRAGGTARAEGRRDAHAGGHARVSRGRRARLRSRKAKHRAFGLGRSSSVAPETRARLSLADRARSRSPRAMISPEPPRRRRAPRSKPPSRSTWSSPRSSRNACPRRAGTSARRGAEAAVGNPTSKDCQRTLYGMTRSYARSSL